MQNYNIGIHLQEVLYINIPYLRIPGPHLAAPVFLYKNQFSGYEVFPTATILCMGMKLSQLLQSSYALELLRLRSVNHLQKSEQSKDLNRQAFTALAAPLLKKFCQGFLTCSYKKHINTQIYLMSVKNQGHWLLIHNIYSQISKVIMHFYVILYIHFHHTFVL